MTFSYKQILKISAPIMIGSAAQNVITLTDVFFLGRLGGDGSELAAIGIVGVFYLILTSVGYCFSKGGQILIARRVGEDKLDEVGRIVWSMLIFEVLLATAMYLFCVYLAPSLFYRFIHDNDIYLKCLEYLYYRAPAIFISCIGVSVIALYTGIARTQIIIYNALVLAVLNIALNYCYVFGNFGFPAMGMGGAALASSLSELGGLVIFVFYIVFDYKRLKHLNFFTPFGTNNLQEVKDITISVVKRQVKISTPIVIQTIIGQGSWFVFFIIVEHLGKEPAAISNVIRAVYMVLMIPCWGFSSGINTIASNLMGQNKIKLIMPVIAKTAKLSTLVTLIVSALVLINPTYTFGMITSDAIIISKSIDLIWILIISLVVLSVSSIYFNGLAGTGATDIGLYLQMIAALAYLVYIYVFVYLNKLGLEFAWFSETVYWLVIFLLSYYYLSTGKWKKIKV
jgi:putative MATE family efflux protein